MYTSTEMVYLQTHAQSDFSKNKQNINQNHNFTKTLLFAQLYAAKVVYVMEKDGATCSCYVYGYLRHAVTVDDSLTIIIK